MSNKSMEMMKKLIEDKKKTGNASNAKPDKKIGTVQKAFNSKKTGGSLNK
jgi:hypothetical protein